ncbi:hypothetical protein H072_11474 [Dactylellina haptotyla CBS 200.50]|uniref:Uncharacterized protein n=1 Tax=Dactylellina haptotyla (strain CBS 200.50) TaxID=1284197 RepID=S8B8D0_DACHA|nr:hypothetical protein H072_11474 [Dactylellina haptotyla CBS 200.50]
MVTPIPPDLLETCIFKFKGEGLRKYEVGLTERQSAIQKCQWGTALAAIDDTLGSVYLGWQEIEKWLTSKLYLLSKNWTEWEKLLNTERGIQLLQSYEISVTGAEGALIGPTVGFANAVEASLDDIELVAALFTVNPS